MQLTDSAQEALKHATRYAAGLCQGYVGTEHILAGLIKEPTGVAHRVLEENGVTQDRVVDLIRELIAFDKGVEVAERGIYSPRAKRVLQEAQVQAQRFGQNETGTEHLLLALIRESDSVAARLLNTLSVNMQKLYADTLEAMGVNRNLAKEDLGRKNRGKNKTETLSKYSRDLTAMAKAGELDPVIGRDEEIRRPYRFLCQGKARIFRVRGDLPFRALRVHPPPLP